MKKTEVTTTVDYCPFGKETTIIVSGKKYIITEVTSTTTATIDPRWYTRLWWWIKNLFKKWIG